MFTEQYFVHLRLWRSLQLAPWPVAAALTVVVRTARLAKAKATRGSRAEFRCEFGKHIVASVDQFVALEYARD